ncbi:MAG: tetratricopeptide repeat protein [Ignavibacteria bacterium]|nr:tetratricopeptide repeat protein [Ignavibacteria bacterium]
MPNSTIQSKIDETKAEFAKGNYDEADRCANELLALSAHDDASRIDAFISLATTARMRGKYDYSLEVGLQALSLAEEFNHPQKAASALNVIGIIYRNFGLYDKALEYYARALELCQNLGDARLTAQITGNMGMVNNCLGLRDKALEYFHEALALYHQSGDKSAIASITVNIGSVYDYLGSYDQALEYYTTALEAYEALGEKSGVASCIGNIGIVYKMIGTYDKALDYFTRALNVHEELGEKSAVARVKQNIGLLYQELGQYDRALEYYNQALETQEEFGAKSEIAQILGNIGIVYTEQYDLEIALDYYHRALAIHTEIGDKSGATQVTGNIGNVYATKKDFDNALEYYSRTKLAYEELGEQSGIALMIGNIGAVYADVDFPGFDADIAEEYLRKAIALNESLGIKNTLSTNYKNLANLYEYQHDAVKALEVYKKYHTMEKEVQSEDNKKQAQRAAFERQIGEMQREQIVTERILYNILPKDIANRIRRGDEKIIDSYDSVSVLFADIVEFTKLSHQITAEQLVEGLDEMFNTFDRLADKHGCEKIKTIGDCYMVVAGLPERCDDHAMRLTLLALEMQSAIENFPHILSDGAISIRIGMHSGSVVAGIIGKNKFSYDLWGDAVNTASRMESHGEPGKIHVSEEFKQALQKGPGLSQESPKSPKSPKSFHFQEREEMSIKGKGIMNTYFLESYR